MSQDKRPALRVLPAFDPDNNIGAVDRIRFCIVNNRMNELHQAEHEQLERWKQVNDWIREGRYQTVDRWGEPDFTIINGHTKLRHLIMTVLDVSWDTAERDIINTKKFFREVYDDQEYYRSVYIEQFEREALEAAKVGKYAAAERLRFRAAELRGLYLPPKEETPVDKVEAFQLNIEYNPEAVGLKTVENKEEHFERWRAKKTKSISEKMNLEADDAASD